VAKKKYTKTAKQKPRNSAKELKNWYFQHFYSTSYKWTNQLLPLLHSFEEVMEHITATPDTMVQGSQ
jgi:hypothetical protein